MCAVVFDPSLQSTMGGMAGTLEVGESKSGQEQQQAVNGSGGGDVVEISEEALALFRAKMEEYGAESTSDLSDEEVEDLKQTLVDSGLIPEAEQAENSTGAVDSGQGASLTLDASAQAGGARGGSETSSDDEDEMEDLEEEIEELQKEIEELQAKANTDQDAKEELKAKRAELALLEAELALLEQQTSQA